MILRCYFRYIVYVLLAVLEKFEVASLMLFIENKIYKSAFCLDNDILQFTFNILNLEK